MRPGSEETRWARRIDLASRLSNIGMSKGSREFGRGPIWPVTVNGTDWKRPETETGEARSGDRAWITPWMRSMIRVCPSW